MLNLLSSNQSIVLPLNFHSLSLILSDTFVELNRLIKLLIGQSLLLLDHFINPVLNDHFAVNVCISHMVLSTIALLVSKSLCLYS
jgi:hypothetical protein